ncbi:toxic anion resistance protein [Alkalispirochaeta alkalica]|uniref:toxic anion resistance protein n=1 Tax=Alkalispirochaeta alkalica TaxID=46356 RepID=UPI000372B292|nr:toxic anion resistance protein [Alkalispirochaeta alkalica]
MTDETERDQPGNGPGPSGQDLIGVNDLAPDLRERARQIAAGLDVRDRQSVVQFGVGPQRRISEFAEKILSEVRARDGGEAGEVLGGLVSAIRSADVGSLAAEPSGLGRLFGGAKRRINAFLQRYETIASRIDGIVSQLEQARMGLLRDIALLDTLYTKNTEYLQELDVHIAAGALLLEEVRTRVLPEYQEQARLSGDPSRSQQLQDMNQLVSRFEKKLHDMQLSRMVAIQTAPQIRLIQGNNETLVEKIQNSILTTIPLWKSQVVIALGLVRQKKALELQRQVTDTTNELLEKNARMLRESSAGVARESERAIVEIETLKTVNDELIATIEETLQIQQEGREKRARAEEALAEMESDLSRRLQRITAGEDESSREVGES